MMSRPEMYIQKVKECMEMIDNMTLQELQETKRLLKEQDLWRRL
jgi:hypothetical protein